MRALGGPAGAGTVAGGGFDANRCRPGRFGGRARNTTKAGASLTAISHRWWSCRRCNSGFSRDETHLLCILHAALAGPLYPDLNIRPEAANVARSNRDIVQALRNRHGDQGILFDNIQHVARIPDSDRVGRVVLNHARGHACHELGEPLIEKPVHLSFMPLLSMACRPEGGL